MQKIELNDGNVLLQEIKPENITASGIYITPIKWNRKFLVIDSNSEFIKKDDIVFVEIGKGTEIELNNKNFFVYNENNIMAIVQ